MDIVATLEAIRALYLAAFGVTSTPGCDLPVDVPTVRRFLDSLGWTEPLGALSPDETEELRDLVDAHDRWARRGGFIPVDVPVAA